MGTAIRTRIVKIGNSQGIRIPKLLLEQSGIGEEVEIEIQDCQLIVRAASQSRQGWDEAFARMAKQHDDALLDDGVTTKWEHLEWEW
ncbi:MAG: AbrB/MazE/SpoVT family DNA-binding domain-containing protein [Nostoc sp. ChiQUE02]|uniref:AbrB/MazE/SpoVT family DNA-binding domain-containing protein n=1 Tax=Nostoc sp. ChiQUE02 TaxID=3075377 RepID=UPI002AD2F071|nr:AbrB/MazE/SpoVT family DNA-binding domain-containing protein [Nostoc sp. ChiQUE02]MDZ8230535.1 AbrB/MazE/SpoVT family DNA-binding domain-containing protein [Nostoc sp. ChiQUE02]